MKTVKLTKKMLSMYPQDLLVKLGAVNKEKTQVFPSDVYFSKSDLKTLTENITKLAKKQYPLANKKYISNVVGFELLNYGPNESLSDAVKPGFAVVDTKESDV